MTDAQTRYSDARELAAEVLVRARPAGPFVADLFDNMAAASGLDERDRGLAFELACGVVRHRRTLDRLADAFSRRPLLKSPPPLRVLVRLGIYQLVFLDRVPDHAAVDCTVELAKRWARRRMHKHPASIASFTNGLLRAVAGARGQRVESDQGADPRRLVEQPGGEGFVPFDRDLFAAPSDSPGDYLADAFSLPPWLAARWVARWGLEQAREVARAQNRRPGLTLRPNSLRTSPQELAARLAEEGVEVRPRPAGGQTILRVVRGDAIGAAALGMGLYQPQDAWAVSVAPQLAVRGGMTVLDRCAAPGVKTTQLVELMGNRGRIIAVDVDDERLAVVRANCQRLGCRIVETVAADRMIERLAEIGAFDRALVDAPCSNSGVLARRPEARWRLDPTALDALARAQRDLLMDAINWLAPGGRCVYSTCSLEPEENEQVVHYALKRRGGQVRLIHEKLTLPSLRDDHDGGYWALIERLR